MGRKARISLAIAATLALVLLLPPSINVNRYKTRVSGAIAGAMGRPVSVGSVSMRLLPQPGLVLGGFAVADDPRFSAEPMLRADQVVATFRLSSLWRGRLEIGSLSLKEPSLNLVRIPGGEWNIESLLVRAAQTPTAPTPKPRPESRPRFPYIEADGGRINFKFGPEKKAWALTEADFALWLASEGEWRTRLAARPVRTDASMSDTATLRVNGTLQRTGRIADTVIKLRVSLQDAQLGQLSTLIYGRDRGWRGGTDVTVDVAGVPAHLTLSASARVRQFRRYDITPPDSLDLEARCVGQFWSERQRLDDIECHLPAGDGELLARGRIESVLEQRVYDLSLVARDLPMSYAVAFARRAKKNLPDDLSAGGVVNAALSLRSEGGSQAWAGGGSTRGFRIASEVLQRPLELGQVEFAIEPDGAPPSAAAQGADGAAPHGSQVAVHPFAMPLGASPPTTVEAMLSRTGYAVQLSGPAAVQRVLQVARALGVQAPTAPVQGNARLALRIAGPWQGFAPPVVTGSAEVQNARLELAGVAGPVHIASAAVSLSPTQVQMQRLAVTLAGGAVAFNGWLRQPRGCASLQTCPIEFGLRADRLALDDLNLLLNPRLRSQPWYKRLAGSGPATASLWSRLHASGTVQVGRLAIKDVVVQNLGGTLRLEPGTARLAGASGSLLGGTIHGDWRADFSGPQPAYTGAGMIQRVAMAQVAAAMRDHWATGAVDANYQLATAGGSAADLLSAAAGSLEFDWRDGALRHLTLVPTRGARPAPGPEAGALRIRQFRGHATLRGRVLSIADARMETPEGLYTVSGTASGTRELALTFSLNGQPQFTVGGTLNAPRVAAVVLPPARAAVER